MAYYNELLDDSCVADTAIIKAATELVLAYFNKRTKDQQ